MSSNLRGLQYLDSLPLWSGLDGFGLDNPKRILGELGNPQDKVRSIHVAGTNGKGSVCALIGAMLRLEGYSVGQFASPHLSHVTERCIINGAPISEIDFGRQVDVAVETARGIGIRLSYFETVTVAAFLQFAEMGLDWMVIEVGLGGRLDATNTILQPEVSVITTIGYDHTHILGDTLSAIAREKAGIFRPSTPVFVGDVTDDVKSELIRCAAEVGAPIEFYGDDFNFDYGASALVSDDGELALNVEELALAGEHQVRNAVLASRVAQHLGVDSLSIEEGWRRARWPGRLELIRMNSGEPIGALSSNVYMASNVDTASDGDMVGCDLCVLFDVAHNPEGIDSLARYLEALADDRTDSECAISEAIVPQKIVFVLSILDRKDWRAMLDRMRALIGSLMSSGRKKGVNRDCQLVFTDSGHHCSVDPNLLRDYYGSGLVVSSSGVAFETALSSAGPQGLVVVTGSIYLVGKVRPLVSPSRFRTIE